MSAEIMKKEDNKITLKIVVGADQFEVAINKAYNKMKSSFNIPGFRKGKVPRKLVEQRYGVEVFFEDAMNIVLPDAYEGALQELNIDPIDRPEFDFGEIKKGEDVEFTAEVQVMPEFTVEGYKGIEVEKNEYNVQEEDVQNELNKLTEQNARMIAVEDRPVQDGDMVVIDYKGFVGEDQFEGGTAEKQSLTIGSNQFIPGFEEQLIGASIGDEIKVKVTFPEEYHSEELAGKEATFEVMVHEIKEKELPALDDEFAKDVSEFDTLAELKADLSTKLEESAKKRTEQEYRNNVIEAVANQVELEIPNAVIERQINNMLLDFDYQLKYQGMTLESYYQMTGTKEEDLRGQMREDAEKRAKQQLVLDRISEMEKIEATETDVSEELERMATQYKQELDKLKSNLRDQDYTSIKEGIIVRKTIDLLAENAKVS
ncbi:trigger factor [Alkaliphilus metalliredigens QYMF]|uniref:Trigger factor n=1 Tax=Alkaliphilus metalliredigens (strain QYMF) TaxID=293826 RepID=TIG_ALKMQ|nr:trigger factor [Alkaliphilus metalliredigens]A6TM60.1 RecName: Full=Trigger factor; Short=TF; AltName: Full=PPIase [Alkaliphilus metalliredigens QYMF]ABR47278.1 trigger factor [Alkaliphilus metalliredigens QYMF]